MNLLDQQMSFSLIKPLLLSILLLGIATCYANFEPEPPAGDMRLRGGIENLGTTCYMNATLQILNAFYRPCIEKKSNADPLAKPLQELLHTITTDKKTASANQATAVFQALGPQSKWTLNKNEQCDASELLHFVWDWMKGPLLSTCNTFIQHTSDNKPIPVTHSTTKCEDACMHYVSLPSHKEVCDLQQLFDHSLAPEQSNEDYKKDAGTTIKNVYKHKQLSLLANEEGILPLQSNRFATKGGLTKQADKSYEKESFEKVKLQNRVTNLMNLKVSRKQTTDNQERDYILLGFIWHSGSIDSGHYKAYLNQNKTWICFDDSTVRRITDVEAATRAQEAYIFFYLSTQPAGGPSSW